MFEDALMESGGKIRTHRTWTSSVAAICNGSIACLLVLLPLLHPASLPRQTLSMLLAAPATPAPPLPHMPYAASIATHAAAFVNPFTPPRIIPDHIATADHQPPTTDADLAALARESGGSLRGLPDSIGPAAPPRVSPAKKPVISSGVMAGNRLSGADPRYPAIARAARVQGTVVLAATISRSGTIENLRVISGPPMLAPAAEEAVRTWRYRPYLLNGEPVEVETTVNVIFNLGG
ncbi:MAG TPA: energy transducer TonB [Acidobacteriaceae bacterium]|jgi:protein TonB|nr:energy transducer TonB [Acidobacteriaceae bacterium]